MYEVARTLTAQYIPMMNRRMAIALPLSIFDPICLLKTN